MGNDSSTETEDLGGGFALRLHDTDNYTTQATLVRPDGGEETIVGGFESECPEDMIWCRDLGQIFRIGLGVGKAIADNGDADALRREGHMLAAQAVEENLFAVWDEWRQALASDNPDPGAWNAYLAKWMRAQASDVADS